MGLIVDSSILIGRERKGLSLEQIVQSIQQIHGTQPLEISVVTIAEMTHGVYRAQHPHQARQRQHTIDALMRIVPIHDLTVPIAALAGRVEGEQAARGFAIPFEDLIIGATALSLNFAVLTANPRHFQLIPDLTVLTL